MKAFESKMSGRGSKIVVLVILVAIVGAGFVVSTLTSAKGAIGVGDNPYTRPYPMKHGYWKHQEEFYAFASGGQQGGIYVYGIPSMKLLSEIPIFNIDPAWGWTLANKEVKEMLTDPYTGEVVTTGDTHHTILSRKDAKYDGRWLFVNDKKSARMARMDLDTFRTKQILWLPNVNGGMHGFHSGPNTKLLVGNVEFEGYPEKKIRDYLNIPIDKLKGPYVSCVFGVEVAEDGTMKNKWQVWGPWQYDMVRVGWGAMDGWFINTAYNTERSVNTVGMFKRPEDYVFFWNIASIEKAIADKKYITSDEAPDVPVIRWKDVECYAAPCPLNPHGLDLEPSGRFAIVGGKATTIVRHIDFLKVKAEIDAKNFVGEEFGIPIISGDKTSGDIDAGLGPTHIEFDNEGYLYAGFFVDSDVKKIAMGGPWTKKHGKEPWSIVDTIPAHYSVGHLLVPGGDTAEPYGKYLVIMNKLTKDTFPPHGPLVTECHELVRIDQTPCPLIDQMPLPPETHYAQAIPVEMIAKKTKFIYDMKLPPKKPNVVYDYGKKEVHVVMTAVRSFFIPDSFTVPEGWKVNLTLTNVEQSYDISHGWALCDHDVMESIDPGETKEIVYTASREGVFWYYCLWFCSELHLEMRGRMIVIPEKEWSRDLEWKAK